MIKLVNQFNNEKSKISFATPTCGCCCSCCCCCLVSTIAVSSISARSFGKFLDDNIERENKEKRYSAKALLLGFFAPLATVVLLALLRAFLIGEFTSLYGGEFMSAIIAVAICLAILIPLFKIAKKEKLKGLIRRLIGFSILGAGLVFGEAIGFIAIMETDALARLYLIVAIIVDLFIIGKLILLKKDNV